ncbi:DUF998 domain-containing protein [Hymenobacter chitinivorans]|uniref:Uncharacterized protein DUF998 n=1 Tax=Hymenobacter chitinivorans DSM 11115 TaxID=1121954 RepID=A0A2M9BPI3_9BACT|nr:DUF998 domain-containing protein [Hymenobacter chitinivorans]PJJ59840.1 uncharacterized protein DUF998 [Hymenobacter chitinivorans DSM 11115]
MLFLLLTALTAYLVLGIGYFGFRRPGYSHLRHTISELGEDGAPNRRAVSWGLFFQVGAGLLLGALLAHTPALRGLLLCLGIGYVVAAVFPCDVGSPSSGSAKQAVHNLGGAVEYIGGIFFLHQAQGALLLQNVVPANTQLGLLIGCLLALSLPGFPGRGLVQRVAEVLLFGQALWLSIP